MSGAALMVTMLVVGALLALTLAVVRLWRGPTAADRVVALDVVFSVNVVLSAAAALGTGRALFLDLAIGLAAIGFVSTIVWARLVAGATEEEP